MPFHPDKNPNAVFPRVSVVIPCRNEERTIGDLVRMVAAQKPDGCELEIIVVNDGSTDRTAACARDAGAKLLEIPRQPEGGNPAAARNRGAEISTGDPIIFLDSDCTPRRGWLATLLRAHSDGVEVVGGSLGLPKGLSWTARCDYYAGWYHVHPARPRGLVYHHPPCNLSVRRSAFLATEGYVESQPIAYSHEELAWQATVIAKGGRILFEPMAAVDHHNRPGFGNLLRRNYRWGYSAIPAKAITGTARFGYLYKHPRALAAVSIPLAIASAGYIAGCWIAARAWEGFLMTPAILLARLAYGIGMTGGGLSWARSPADWAMGRRSRWE